MLYTILLTILLAIICIIIPGSIITRAILQLNMKTKPQNGSQAPTLESEPDCDFDDIPDNSIPDHEFPETPGSNQGKSPTVTVGQLLGTSRPEFIPIKVPFLCTNTPYDNLGFWDFPSRMGWKVNREDRWCHPDCPPGTCKTRGYREAFEAPYGLACPAVIKEGLKASSTPIPTREKIAFLQAWLFFGALDEICTLCGLGLDVTKAFVVEGMVTTEPLNGLPGRLYRASVSQRSDLVPISLMLELLRVARHVRLIITRRTLYDEHKYTFEECLVLSSINILFRTILMTAIHYFPSWIVPWEKAKLILSLADTNWLPEGQSTMQLLLKKQCLPRGWCSVSELDGLDYDSNFFAYFLERPHAHRDHSKCTETKCLASQTDANTYRTTHVSDGCNCSFIAVDPEQLKDSLERNQIPKITVSLDPDNAAGTIALTVIDGGKLPYIAISHVWADGLGNPRENSLPRCQLLRLRDLINNLGNIIHQNHKETHLAFWIDTLCIPVAPHLKDYRRLAIHQIRETFRDATATLVLDKELYNLDTRVISNMEIGIRIFSGGWVKRIWTLKEAVYTLATGDSEKLFFQMKEDLVEWNREHSKFIYHPKDLSHKDKPTFIQDENDSQGSKYTDDDFTVDDLKLEILLETYLEIAMESRLPPLGSLMDSDPEKPQFFKLADAVSRRSTSKQEDEPLCLTFLLGRPAPDLLKTQDVEERMAMFYLELGKIPKAILFEGILDESKPGPWIKAALLQKSPFRWAPASLASLPAKRLKTLSLEHDYLRLVDEDHGLGTCERDGLHIRNNGFLVTGQENRLSQPSSFLKDIDTGENYELVYCKEPPYGYYREVGILVPESSEFSDSVAILQIEEIRVACGDQDSLVFEYYGTIIGHGKFLKSNVEKNPEGHQILYGQMLNRSQRWCIT